MLRSLYLSLVLLFSSFTASAQEIKMPSIFNDHMVLQRNADIYIWGWADARSKITVELGNDNRTTTADFQGRWETFLPAREAGGPFTLTASSDQHELTFEDVYIGDVWLAGGQSNMEWQIGDQIDNMEAELNDADYPEIRFIKIAHDISMTPLNDLKTETEWKTANKENARNFSAVAWFFAKRNHLEKGVPVGIIDDNWGGTPAESWTPAARLLHVEGYKDEAAEMLQEGIDWESRIEQNSQKNTEKYARVGDQTDFLKYGAHKKDYDQSDWEEIELPNQEVLRDFVWLRKSFSLDNISEAKLSFGNPGKFTVAFINGEKVYTKIWSDDPKVIDIDKSVLRKGENIIAIRTVEDWSNSTFIGQENEFWIEAGNQKISLEGTWKFSNTIEPPMPEVVRYENEPSTLYNAMIHPIAGYTIKGAIWYQGESNVGANQYYNELFEAMIEEWRSSWNQGDFPFLFVQLANFQQKYDEPTESGWARLQEAQTQTLSLANTGMAVAIDIGEADDIHPRNKQDVGKRLWAAADHIAFGSDIVYSGPMYAGHAIEGNKIRLAFDHTGSGLTLNPNGERLGFAVAGRDREFHWASEVKIEGNQIVVWSREVDHPVAVRYAWADNPDVSVYNEEGFPGVPFRTDDW
ncbi:MAG: sialate O-acetylesterase [Balneola sp.]|jgi:sialate O-acetylesterase|nr:sialate O-acetylesterase [Balneola sp.]MBE77786.1 sialate O-acetylesterase [Balneola sp.]|tara:strand:+ start:796 stop:2700 length:1905 start_codon:yes stop_codon:yes gene_type:complete